MRSETSALGAEKYYTRKELDKIMYEYIKESAKDLKKEIYKSNNKEKVNKKIMYA